jgi:hypothetical protein
MAEILPIIWATTTTDKKHKEELISTLNIIYGKNRNKNVYK